MNACLANMLREDGSSQAPADSMQQKEFARSHGENHPPAHLQINNGGMCYMYIICHHTMTIMS